LRYHTRVGERDALHCTGLGKVLISEWPPERLSELVTSVGLPRRTVATILDWADLDRALERIRQRGYAEDQEEGIIGLRCLAAPVRDAHGALVAAISISGAAAEFEGDNQVVLLAALLEQARGLSQRLGWTPV
jgi:DNA-binding IclR family transcriptional regulator